MSTASVVRPKGRTKARDPITLDRRALSSAVGRFKLISDETRLQTLSLLSAGPLCVTNLCDRLGMSQPAVSHHLALLRVGGLIEGRRDGKYIHYSLTEAAWPLLEAAAANG